MPDITLLGWTTPFRPNSGQARLDTDPVPALSGGFDVLRMSLAIPGPTTLSGIASDALGLLLTFLGPVALAAAETHGSPTFDFTTPTNPTAQSVRTQIVVGDTQPPSLSSAVALSQTSVLVTFSEAVVQAEAMNPANYAADHGLVVVGVTRQSATQYLLATSAITPGLLYTVVVSNIHDLNGNLVA